MSELAIAGAKLADALAECERLRKENRDLRKRLGLSEYEIPALIGAPVDSFADSAIHSKSSSEKKVKLFRSLFRGREDVYAVRWEGRNGKTGYSPAYRKIWSSPFQRKPDAPKEYFPLTDQVIHDHLTGKLTAGVYPLLMDETCWFLAADFDKATWQHDVRAFLQICAGWNIPASLERSRSGRGGHVWIFFATPLPANLARKLGAAILTRTMECRHELGLDSYDRLFPSQDTMPKGGFGNLIALPLQHLPRAQGNSLFLDADFNLYPDQWAFLSSLRRMTFAEVDTISLLLSNLAARLGLWNSRPRAGIVPAERPGLRTFETILLLPCNLAPHLVRGRSKAQANLLRRDSHGPPLSKTT